MLSPPARSLRRGLVVAALGNYRDDLARPSAGVKSPGAVAARIANTADGTPCPADMSLYAPFPALDGGAPQVCQGGAGSNAFYGKGQVNALRAIGG